MEGVREGDYGGSEVGRLWRESGRETMEGVREGDYGGSQGGRLWRE